MAAITEERRNLRLVSQDGDAGNQAARFGDRKQLRRRQRGAGHERVEQQLVGRRGIPPGVVASDVHQMLRLLADEALLGLPRQMGFPEPVVEVFVGCQLARTAAQRHDLAKDRCHPPPCRDRCLQVAREVNLRDAVERGECVATVGDEAGAHELELLAAAVVRITTSALTSAVLPCWLGVALGGGMADAIAAAAFIGTPAERKDPGASVEADRLEPIDFHAERAAASVA